MNVLILGSTGFIGRRTVKYCIEEGWNITVGARDVSKAREIFKKLPVEIKKIDISNWDFEIGNYDVVINLAALLPKKCNNIEEMFNVNSLGVYRLLKKCKVSGISRVIHSSSMAVFGMPQYLPVDELHPKDPTTYYGTSKLAGELFIKNKEWEDTERIVLRYSSVYGPGMDENEVVSIFMRKMLRGEDVKVVTDSTADFVFVDDVAKANILAVKSEIENEFEDFNIGSGNETSIEEVAKIIKQVTDSRSKIVPVSGNSKRFYFNIKKAREMLKFEPETTLEEGIAIYLDAIGGGKNGV